MERINPHPFSLTTTSELANVLGWLMAATIALIGLDEFTLNIGIMSLKFCMVPMGIALGLYGLNVFVGGRLHLPRNIPAVIFLVYVLFLASLFYAGMVDSSELFTNIRYVDLGPLSSLRKTFNLFMLVTFAYMGARFLTPRQLRWGALGLLACQVAVASYCIWLLLHGDLKGLWWNTNGTPKLVLAGDGTPANQMAGMWLMAAMLLMLLRVHGRGPVWDWLWILLALAGGATVMSRSNLVGGALLFFSYAFKRPRPVTVFATIAVAMALFLVSIVRGADSLNDASALSRLTFWATSINNFIHNFPLGSSMGTDPAPHSVWIQLLSETGLPGIVLALSAIAWTFLDRSPSLGRSAQVAAILFLPYLPYLSVDIPLLQWQTWCIPIAAALAFRHLIPEAPEPLPA